MLYENISYEEYAARGGLRSSQLKKMKDYPIEASPEYIKANPQPKKPAFEWGKAVHYMVEHNSTEPPEIAVFTDGKTRGSKAYKAFEIANKGKTLLLESEFVSTKLAFESLISDAEVITALDGSIFESSWFWTDKDTGLKCQIRADIYQEETHHIYDLKTCRDVRPRKFFSDARYSFGYLNQAAFYCDGMKQITGKRPDFFFICVLNKAPYATGVYEVDHGVIDFYIKQNRFLMREYADCLSSGDWNNSFYDVIELTDYEREQDV